MLTPIRLVARGHVVGVPNRFRAHGELCEFFKCDRKSAYNALPADPQETRFAAITPRSPKDGEYYAFISRTLLFGPIASVLRYNVSARIVAELFSLIFGIPAISLFGDFGAQTPPPLIMAH